MDYSSSLQVSLSVEATDLSGLIVASYEYTPGDKAFS